MVATRSSAPANVNEFKDVNMDSNSDAGTNSSTNANAEVDIGVVANASTLTKEPADTNETTMGGLHAGIDISMDKDDYLVRSMGRFEVSACPTIVRFFSILLENIPDSFYYRSSVSTRMSFLGSRHFYQLIKSKRPSHMAFRIPHSFRHHDHLYLSSPPSHIMATLSSA